MAGQITQHRSFWPLVCAALFLLVSVLFYAPRLPDGAPTHIDEYLTLDRSHSFILHNDPWTVYTGNRPNFNKPPLQYWMSAQLMRQGIDLETTLRLPALVFGLLLLVTVGLLTWAILPGTPWAVPLAVFIAGSSTQFWQAAMAGLLDTGSAFFCCLAMTGTFLAFRQPRWWYAVALACGLGALHKAPIPFAFALITFASVAGARLSRGEEAASPLKTIHFALALLLAVALMAFWPAVQWMRHGPSAIAQMYGREILDRISPFENSGGGSTPWFRLMLGRDRVLSVLGIAAALWLPFRLKRMELLFLPAIVVAYALLAASASGHFSTRYAILFVPIYAVSLAVLILTLAPNRALAALAAVVISATSLGPLKTANALRISGDDQTRFVPQMQAVAAALTPEENLLLCRSRKGRFEVRVRNGAFSYYASAGRPFFIVSATPEAISRLASGRAKPPYRGLCTKAELDAIRPALSDVVVVSEVDDYVHFTAKGAAAR